MKLQRTFFNSVLTGLICISFYTSEAQQATMARQTFSQAGGTYSFNSGEHELILQQSIGQASVIGLFGNNARTLRQGFLQPRIRTHTVENQLLQVTCYPNPFEKNFTIHSNGFNTSHIHVTIMDLTGRIVYSNMFMAQTAIIVSPDIKTPGMYLLLVQAGKATYTTKIQHL